MAIEREAKLQIKVDVQAEAKSARGLLDVLSAVERAQERIRSARPSRDFLKFEISQADRLREKLEAIEAVHARISKYRGTPGSTVGESPAIVMQSQPTVTRSIASSSAQQTSYYYSREKIPDVGTKAKTTVDAAMRDSPTLSAQRVLVVAPVVAVKPSESDVTPTVTKTPIAPSAPPDSIWSRLINAFASAAGLIGTRMARGGIVQQRYGTGGDDEPIRATPGETVIPVGPSRRYRTLLQRMISGDLHFGGGGTLSNKDGPKFGSGPNVLINTMYDTLAGYHQKTGALLGGGFTFPEVIPGVSAAYLKPGLRTQIEKVVMRAHQQGGRAYFSPFVSVADDLSMQTGLLGNLFLHQDLPKDVHDAMAHAVRNPKEMLLEGRKLTSEDEKLQTALLKNTKTNISEMAIKTRARLASYGMRRVGLTPDERRGIFNNLIDPTALAYASEHRGSNATAFNITEILVKNGTIAHPEKKHALYEYASHGQYMHRLEKPSTTTDFLIAAGYPEGLAKDSKHLSSITANMKQSKAPFVTHFDHNSPLAQLLGIERHAANGMVVDQFQPIKRSELPDHFIHGVAGSTIEQNFFEALMGADPKMRAFGQYYQHFEHGMRGTSLSPEARALFRRIYAGNSRSSLDRKVLDMTIGVFNQLEETRNVDDVEAYRSVIKVLGLPESRLLDLSDAFLGRDITYRKKNRKTGVREINPKPKHTKTRDYHDAMRLIAGGNPVVDTKVARVGLFGVDEVQAYSNLKKAEKEAYRLQGGKVLDYEDMGISDAQLPIYQSALFYAGARAGLSVRAAHPITWASVTTKQGGVKDVIAIKEQLKQLSERQYPWIDNFARGLPFEYDIHAPEGWENRHELNAMEKEIAARNGIRFASGGTVAKKFGEGTQLIYTTPGELYVPRGSNVGTMIKQRFGTGGDDEPILANHGDIIVPTWMTNLLKQRSGKRYATGGEVDDPERHYAPGGIVGNFTVRQQHAAMQAASMQFLQQQMYNQMYGHIVQPQPSGQQEIGGLFGLMNGPLGKAILAIKALGEVVEKVTTSMNIAANSQINAADKARSIVTTWVPGAAKIAGFNDALENIPDRIRQANTRLMFADAERPIRAAYAEQRSEIIAEARSPVNTARAFNAVGLERGQYTDSTTSLGGIRANEEAGLLAARDAIVQAQRRYIAADMTLQGQTGSRDHWQREAASRRATANRAGERLTNTLARQDFLGDAHLNPIGTATGTSASVRNAASWRADRIEQRAAYITALGNRASANTQLMQEERRLREVSLEQERARNELVQARINLQREELRQLEARQQRMTQHADSLGGAGYGGRMQSRNAWRIVRRMQESGREEFIAPQLLQMAARFAPGGVRDIERRLGERFIRSNIDEADEVTQRDWRNGASLRSVDREAFDLRMSIRGSTDDAARTSAQEIARIFAESMRQMLNTLADNLRIQLQEIQERERLRWDNNVR